MLNIKENLTVINQWLGRGNFKIEGVVIHSMAGTYAGSIQWFKNPKAKASAHYCIRSDGEVTLTVKEDNTAWHAGIVTVAREEAPGFVRDNWGVNPNFISIGLELEDLRQKNRVYPKVQYSSAIELVADICRRYNLPVDRDRIVMHKEIDPINRTDPVGEWDQDDFIKEVKSCLLEGGVELQILGKPDKIKVTSPLNVRSGPARSYRLSGCRVLNRGDKVDVSGFVEGEEIDGIKYWYKSTLGNYFWSGGTSTPILSKVELIGNMTKQEFEAKKLELDSRAEAIEARRVELENAVVLNQQDKASFDVELQEFQGVAVEEEPMVAPEPVAEAVVEPVVESVEVKLEEPQTAEEAVGFVASLEAKIAEFKAKFGL